MRRSRGLPLFWLLQLGGWLAFGVAMSLSRLGSFPLDYMVVTKGVLTTLGFLTTLALRPLFARLVAGGAGRARLLMATLAASYGAALVWTAAYNVFSAVHHTAYFGEPRRIGSVGALLNGSVYHAFALLAWSVLYVGLKDYQALQDERERAARAEALASRARLDALRYQLNPHFLFNAMNAVSTLVVEGRNAEAARMLARLSDFLRLTLDGPDAQEVPLADEVELARRYLEIEQVRFGERLRVAIDVDDRVLAMPVPTLILQPLVENAIKHAVAPREDGGSVAIVARREGTDLLLRVVDDGPGLAGDCATASCGIGLANTRERLRQLHGAGGRVELTEADGGGLAVSLYLPVASPAARPALALTGAAS